MHTVGKWMNGGDISIFSDCHDYGFIYFADEFHFQQVCERGAHPSQYYFPAFTQFIKHQRMIIKTLIN